VYLFSDPDFCCVPFFTNIRHILIVRSNGAATCLQSENRPSHALILDALGAATIGILLTEMPSAATNITKDRRGLRDRLACCWHKRRFLRRCRLGWMTSWTICWFRSGDRCKQIGRAFCRGLSWIGCGNLGRLTR